MSVDTGTASHANERRHRLNGQGDAVSFDIQSFRSRRGSVEAGLASTIGRMASGEVGLAGLITRMARMETRLTRIDRRLALGDLEPSDEGLSHA